MLSPEIRKKIRSIEIRTSRMVSDVLAGQYRSAFKGRGMEFEEVRPYMFGDDVRSIDWNVSARAGEPHVKVFREERELTVMLAVDLSRSLAMGTRSELKRELVAEIAATLAFSAIRSNDRVGMLLFTDRIEAIVPPKKGARHVLRIVRDLLAFTPQGRGTDIARALDELNASLSKRTVVCVISDFLAPAQAKPWEGALARLRRRHDVIPIIVTDARERELPDVGIIDLEDLETGEVRAYDTSSRWVREGWAEVAEDRAQARDRLFRKAKTEPLLLAYFSRREARRSR
jgi:uncharacterized protein (DUF58 family)